MPDEICYVEIAVKDIAGARKFYEAAFGWKTTPSGDHYAMFETGGPLGGGLTLQEEGRFDGPVLLYIKVADIPAALAKVVATGGTVVEAKRSIGEYGFIGVFRDPSGNLMGLWAKT